MAAVDLGRALCARLRDVVAIGDTEADLLVTAVIAGGHVLIEGVPGIGKTLLARTLAKGVQCEFRRIQFTNDLMPSDVVGGAVWRPDTGKLSFVKGPLFADIVLADEINRTSPRTLSCLLEAMESGTVSIDGKEVRLGQPFVVLATRNPIEFHGTQPMPEAALDRFMLCVALAYPEPERELALYRGDEPTARLEGLAPILTKAQLLELAAAARAVQVGYPVAAYCHTLAQATRRHPQISLGCSPRAALALLAACRARACLAGRDFVLPDDIKALFLPVLAHRVSAPDRSRARVALEEILAHTPVTL